MNPQKPIEMTNAPAFCTLVIQFVGDSIGEQYSGAMYLLRKRENKVRCNAHHEARRYFAGVVNRFIENEHGADLPALIDSSKSRNASAW